MSQRARPVRLLALVPLVALSAACSTPTAGDPASEPTRADVPSAADEELRERVQGIADGLVQAGAPAVVVDVRTAGDGRASAAAGVADTGTGAPAEPDSALRIASISKAMVAAVVLQLVEEGALALDGPVDDVLPGVLRSPSPVTVRQLLAHTSGLPDHLGVLVPDAAAVRFGGDIRYTAEDLLEVAQAQPWRSEPGAAFSYSNTGYTVLGEVVEAVTGRPVAAEVTDRVIDPLGLGSTTWPTDAAMPEGSLSGYLDEGGTLVDVTSWDPSLWSAGASVVSTVEDVSTFFEGLWGGALLTPASVAEMQTIGAEGYGLGTLAGGDVCGAEPAELLHGQRGNGFGYRTISLASADGDRVATIGWTAAAYSTADDTLVGPGGTALVELLALTCP